jgi:hypothetical protein
MLYIHHCFLSFHQSFVPDLHIIEVFHYPWNGIVIWPRKHKSFGMYVGKIPGFHGITYCHFSWMYSRQSNGTVAWCQFLWFWVTIN